MALTPITWFVFFAVAGYVTCNYPAPTNVKSTYLPDKGVIRVNWTDHPDHPSDSYRLLITRSSRYQWMISDSRRTYDLPYSVDYTGTTFSFVLFGYNSNLGRFSELTDSINFRTPYENSKPGYVKVSYTSSRAVKVSWIAASSYNVKQYVVVYRHNTTVFKETVPAARTSLVTRSLTYNTTYRIQVYTVLNNGTFGALSEEHPFIPVIDDASTIKSTQTIPISDSTEKEYNIRLVEGGERWRGRLEVFHLGQWGTVCDEGFGSKEALAVCRELGYNSFQKEPVAYHGSYFGYSNGPIFLDNVNCPTESSYAHFRQCSSNGWGNIDCMNDVEVSVNCNQDSKPNAVVHAEFIRLQSGRHPWMGRLEVYHGGKWGTVCGDGFSTAEAVAVCNQLGFKISERDPVVYTDRRGEFRPIWLDDVTCPKIHPHLILRQCNSSAWSEHNCYHFQDVYVNCLPDNSTGIQEVRQLRLIGGGKPWRGRLEVFHYGQWGTVCGAGFGKNEALTVCRQLGYKSSLRNPEAYPNAVYGRGSGVILLDNVKCSHNSSRLLQCTSDPWGTIDFQYCEDVVSVNCFQEEEEYNIRLVSGGKPWRGRLEIFHGGIWGTVCSDSFGTSEAIATCNQLGYNTSDRDPEAYPRAVYGEGSGPIWLENVDCPDEADSTYLKQCTSGDWGVHDCRRQVVSVNCVQEEEEYNIRLVSGGKPWRGRLEVFHGGIWGTVRSNNFGTSEAIATCNQLGYNTSDRDPEAYPNAVYGEGSGQIWLDNVACPDEADNLQQCTSAGWGVRNWWHDRAVSVNCVQEEENVTIRLADGGYPWRGRLEVYKGGLWGTVCDDGFHTKEAISVCNQLGYNTSHREPILYKSPLFGIGSGPIWFDNINCPDDVSNVDFRQCTSKGLGVHNCNHNEDVTINCLKENSTENEEEFSIRLADGGHPSRGRLEVYHAGQWGTVCGNGFHINEAISVCYQLGYRTFLRTPVAYHRALFGAGSGPIWLSNVDCPPFYTNTLFRNCTSKPWGSHSCHHSMDVSVNCYQVKPTISQSPPDAVLGRSVILTCNKNDYLFWDAYDWKVNGSAIYNNHKYFRNGSELLIHSLDLSDRTNEYSCVGREHNGSISDPVYHSFDIRYEPLITRAEYSVNGGGSHILLEGTSIQVNEYDHLLLTMETNANPAASVKLFKEQSKTEGINTTLLIVVYNQIQCQQTGIYTFEAINRYIVKPLRRQFIVNVHCMPREHTVKSSREFVKKLDETVTLSETVISYPEPTVTWSRHVQTISVAKYNEYTYSFSGNVHITGEKDYGVYVATVKNDKGELRIEYLIRPDENRHLNMVLIIVSTSSGLVIICACVITIICVCKRRKGRQARRNDRENQYDFSLANRNPEQASGSGIEMVDPNYRALEFTRRNRSNIYDVVN